MSQFLTQPLAVILFLGVLVLFHETGHCLVGKVLRLPAEIFSIGFGPVILKWQRKETEYRLSIVPLGGFVKFYGSTSQDEVPLGYTGMKYHEAPLYKRALTVAAGPFANFLLAVLVFAFLGFKGIAWPPAVVGEVLPDSPAAQAGLTFGDQVKAIGGVPVANWRDLQKQIGGQMETPLLFSIDRRGKPLEVTIKPRAVPDEEAPVARQKGQIGITPMGLGSVLAPLSLSPELEAQGVKGPFQVKAISLGSESRPIRFMGEVLLALEDWRLKELESITLNIVAPGAPEETPTQSLVLTPDPKLRTEASALVILKALGLGPADLLVKSLEPEAEGQLEPMDRLLSYDNTLVTSLSELRRLNLDEKRETVPVSIERKGQVINLNLKLHPEDIQRPEGKLRIYLPPMSFFAQTVAPAPVYERYDNPILALGYGVAETYRHGRTITEALVGLVTGKVPLKVLGGPIAIAKVASDSVRLGLEAFLGTLAIISVNLGLLNLFPIPVLDGGQLVLLGMEAIYRKPLAFKLVESYQKLGFVMVLSLVFLATYNDLARFWSGLFAQWSGQ